ncbi:penicillin-binding protein [Streptomyces caatingaensis]|uniref:Penicillin-binding protein n=2 Tax=Streptomyces caatingaensis TaxID=1678637 RepID=A0A0K9XHE2_9ACTN|nr:penicillin-binding protein [Streptomyces caatingaensis]
MPGDLTTTVFDTVRWQARLEALRAEHGVPGASLAVLAGGRVHELASGVLHSGTGVEVTTDSVFQLGSVAKVYTATLVMQLAESGELDLDAPVTDVLPDFSVADADAAGGITVRRLLSHTGGLTCDFTLDTGRGDDCLARYVEAAEGVPLDCPPGTALSYSSVGYNVLGRIVEVLTGLTWDEALKQRLLQPLGLERTMTLPEEALRFRAAMGHLGEPGRDPEPAPVWDMMPRSAGPYGRVLATAGDVVRFARMHLDGGMAPDGTRVLDPGTVAMMRRREADCPDKWSVSADGWGLGWSLHDWNGVQGYGHDGAATGQYAYLRVVPETGLAIALTTNGGSARLLYAELFRELLQELAGVRMPDAFAPPAVPPAVDLTSLAGTYTRAGVVISVTGHDGAGRLVYEFVDGMRDFSPPIEAELVPVSRTVSGTTVETVFAASGVGAAFSEDWMPVVFTTLADGSSYCCIGMRAAPKAP